MTDDNLSSVVKRKKVSTVQISANEFYTYEKQDPEINKGPKYGCRHTQAIIMGLGLMAGIATRTNLSVAIVAMTEKGTSPNPDIPTYDWSNTSIILSSYFWGYVSFQILAGYLAKMHGPKYFLFAGFLINSIALGVTPLAAEYLGSNGVIICRITQGLGQGFLFPSANAMLGRWAPEEERSTITNIMYTGSPIGSIVGSLLTGYVSASWWGWPASYYILAIMGISWCFLWLVYGQNSPAEHPTISEEERNYIQGSLKQEDDINMPVPWKKIFRCFPFYILVTAGVGTAWGYAVLLTETPTYMAKVMNFDVESNSVVSSIPTVASLIVGLFLGPLSDWIISRQLLSVLNTRKVFQAIGTYGQALCLVWVSFLKPSQGYLSVVALALGACLSMFAGIGAGIGHLDLSPRFSGIIFGLVNAASIAVSIVASLSTNWIVTESTNVGQWQLVFLIAGGFLAVGGSSYIFCGSATRAEWDGPEDSKLEERRKKVSVVSIMSI